MLKERGTNFHYREYTKEPLSEQELRAILTKLGDGPRAILRIKDYRALALPEDASDDELVGHMVAHPSIIQRPIVIFGNHAVLARPADKLTPFLDEHGV